MELILVNLTIISVDQNYIHYVSIYQFATLKFANHKKLAIYQNNFDPAKYTPYTVHVYVHNYQMNN